MIPKIIHYCWFGKGKLPNFTLKCIESWKKFLPDYEIKIWDEFSFDINSAIPYVKEAYEQKKYAFVTDYVRLYALNKFGGVYFDTDVEVIRNFDDLLEHTGFMCFEDNSQVSTATIGAEPGMEWIDELMELYAHRHFINHEGKMDLTTNVEFISRYLENKGMIKNGEFQSLPFLTIYPSDYFSPKSWSNGIYNITKNTYSIHYFAGTWHSSLNKFLSHFFSNKTIIKIASWKERFFNMLTK